MLTSPSLGGAATAAGDESRAGEAPSLRARLRAETRAAHVAAEAAFDLPARLRSPETYLQGLLVMDAFHRACEPTLAVVTAALPAPLRDGPARRRERLHADLRRLGHSVGPHPGQHATPLVLPAPGPEAALGTWYVHEGAALGGVVIAAETRRRLPAVAAATSYFAGECSRTAARWRSFTAALDDTDPAAHDAVVAGAHATFAHLHALCGPIR